MEKVIIYTDGACSGNPGKGGYGAVLIYKEHEKEISGGEKETTNNKMELRATIEALKSLNKKCDVTIYTDSTYVKNGITLWIKKWKTNGWKTANRKDVKNVDLWVELDELSQKYSIEWRWVKGHSGDKYNEKADELARKGITNLI